MQSNKQVSDNLFDELEKFGKSPVMQKSESYSKISRASFIGTVNHKESMYKLLKEAQEQEVVSSSQKSSKSGDKNEYNHSLLDGPAIPFHTKKQNQTAEQIQIEQKIEDSEPLGTIVNPNGRPQVLQDDPYLEPFISDLYLRQNEYKKWLDIFQGAEGGIEKIARSYKRYGLQKQPNNDITFMEWAPGAKAISIFGDFNGWNRNEFWAQKNEYGCFCLTLKALEDGTPRIKHKMKYKILIVGADDSRMDRNSVWANQHIQGSSGLFDCCFWDPSAEEQHQWININPIMPEKAESDRIYESHVGMAHEGGGVCSYRWYAEHILPRVKKAGYNVIQLMAIQEHSYYGSFGYHVTGFFGVSSRSGSPDDFKFLVDQAHGMGIRIIIDLVHSHASSNVLDGINRFDGTDHCYSHAGPRGYHSAWDSMTFDYSKYEVKRFLLSNLAWFLDVYHVDGFRFDAITSILYNHHGIGMCFTGNYQEYFGMQTDLDGIVYLMLANTLIHKIRPGAITIAEDVSGFPTLCRKIRDGGIGFDYRLGMFLPDMWIKLLKETPDEQWSMDLIAQSMINRRWKEKVVAYSESHDQAIVGDKTISMWLFDDEVYRNMRRDGNSLKVSRGMALHKMIRLITFSLGGQAYLNFMGNEFGHPEWIDFPRAGNNFSYHWCRRQWSLKFNNDLRYSQLGEFDEVMNQWEKVFGVMLHDHEYVTLKDQTDQLIVFERGELVYILNFHPNNSYENYKIGTHWRSDHMILYETDDIKFGGHQRLNGAHDQWVKVQQEGWNKRRHSFKIYIPSRCALVLCPFEFAIKHPEIKMPLYDPESPDFKPYIPINQAFVNQKNIEDDIQKQISQLQQSIEKVQLDEEKFEKEKIEKNKAVKEPPTKEKLVIKDMLDELL